MLTKFMRHSCYSLLLFSVFSLGISIAAAPDPVKWADETTSKVLLSLRENQRAIKANPKKINAIVDDFIVPNVDIDEMAKWVAGRNAWQQADAGTKASFIRELKALVVRTYGMSLNSFATEKVNFLPLRADYVGKERIMISSFVTQKNKNQPLRVDFRLLQEGSEWKFYDMIVEGVSLLKGYQSQFGDDARAHGLGYVTNKIRKLNQRQ